jgi:hypothetical protein
VGNTSTGFFGGGGIYNTGVLTLRSSRVTDNTAETVGGGIANYGSAELGESVVTANTALNGKGGVYGGGIFNSLGTVALSHTKVFGNTPDDCAGC